MKKAYLVVFSLLLLASCSKSKSGREIAEEICECSKKANGLPTSNPTREQAQKDCTAKATEAWRKIKDDMEKAAEYNKVIGTCAEEQIKKSFGQ